MCTTRPTHALAGSAYGRLTNINANGLSWSATYNGDGVRLRQVTNGVPTTYTLDLNASLVQALTMQDAQSASGTTTYLYGVTRIGEQQPGGWAYHLSDALGSVRQLADDAAQVTLARGTCRMARCCGRWAMAAVRMG